MTPAHRMSPRVGFTSCTGAFSVFRACTGLCCVPGLRGVTTYPEDWTPAQGRLAGLGRDSPSVVIYEGDQLPDVAKGLLIAPGCKHLVPEVVKLRDAALLP